MRKFVAVKNSHCTVLTARIALEAVGYSIEVHENEMYVRTDPTKFPMRLQIDRTTLSGNVSRRSVNRLLNAKRKV